MDNTPRRILDLKGARKGWRLRITFRPSDALSVIRRAEFCVDGEHTIAVHANDKVENVHMEKVVVK